MKGAGMGKGTNGGEQEQKVQEQQKPSVHKNTTITAITLHPNFKNKLKSLKSELEKNV